MIRWMRGRSLRTRMLLAALLVETAMLTLLVVNSLRLLSGHMLEQQAKGVAQLTPVLKAALVAPLAQRDWATVQAILDECAANEDLDYLAVTDSSGRIVAAHGWRKDHPLPVPSPGLLGASQHIPARFDTASVIGIGGQDLGRVQFGVDLSPIIHAHRLLLRQGMAIALVELLLSACLLALLSLWITRHLAALTRASDMVARGVFTPPMLHEGSDDIGRLGAAFNAMSAAVRARISELTVSRDIQASMAMDISEAHQQLEEITRTMGDGLYVVDRLERITFVNPRVEEILGWPSIDLIGRSAHELFHCHREGGSLLAGEACPLCDVVQTGAPFRSTSVAYQAQNGGRLHLSVSARPILRGKECTGAVVVFQDVSELHQRTEALRKSEERFVAAVNGSGDGLWDWDVQAGTVYYSDTWKSMIGYLPQEIGSDLDEWKSRVHPEDLPDVLECLQAHLAGEVPTYISEHRFLCRNGSYLWVLDRGVLVDWDSAGRPSRMIGTHTDITARKTMEVDLRRKDMLLEAVSKAVAGLLDSEGWEDDIPGFLQRLGEGTGSSRAYIFKRVSGSPFEGEVMMDHVFEWCSEDVSPQIDNPGLRGIPMRAVGFGRWVDQLCADRMICGRIEDLPWKEQDILAAQGIRSIQVMPIHVRGQWWGLIGFDDCRSARVWSQSEQDVLRISSRALGAKIERTETLVELELRVQERTRELDQKNLDLINEMEARQAVVAESRAVQAELEQARKMESIGRLAAGIAHEINTPIQFLGNNLGFLKSAHSQLDRLLDAYGEAREELPPQSAQALLELQREAALPYLREELPQAIDESLEGIQRVAKIVRAMKEFSHPGGPEKVSVDVNHSLVTTCTVTRSEWKQHAEMVMDLDAGNPVIQGLPAELHQVFLNLVMNAADAIAERQQHDPGPGVITLSTLRIDHGVEIRVSDNGSGIPKDIQSKIFDPFFTTKGVGKGTGQGLTVCYQVVVTRHGGTIQCQSEPGRGTTFLIRLPARDGVGPAQSAGQGGL